MSTMCRRGTQASDYVSSPSCDMASLYLILTVARGQDMADLERMSMHATDHACLVTL